VVFVATAPSWPGRGLGRGRRRGRRGRRGRRRLGCRHRFGGARRFWRRRTRSGIRRRRFRLRRRKRARRRTRSRGRRACGRYGGRRGRRVCRGRRRAYRSGRRSRLGRAGVHRRRRRRWLWPLPFGLQYDKLRRAGRRSRAVRPRQRGKVGCRIAHPGCKLDDRWGGLRCLPHRNTRERTRSELTAPENDRSRKSETSGSKGKRAHLNAVQSGPTALPRQCSAAPRTSMFWHV
jgi:hypothetical protein